jgi:hypothetical protein
MVATPVAKNANKAMVESVTSLESGGQFCVGTFGKKLAAIAAKVFSYLIRNITNFVILI